MESIAKEVRSEGIECSTIVKTGPTSDVVEEIIERTGAGRLILGKRAKHGVGKFLLGSVARSLLERVDVPACIIDQEPDLGFSDQKVIWLCDKCTKLYSVDPWRRSGEQLHARDSYPPQSCTSLEIIHRPAA